MGGLLAGSRIPAALTMAQSEAASGVGERGRQSGWRMPLRALPVRAALVVAGLATAVLVLEGLLRLFPGLWPRGTYGSGCVSPELQLTVHCGPSIYTGAGWIRRIPNRDGFLDVDHAPRKPRGVTRVAFFGDSYVEVVQVPLNDTFFRRLPREIAGRTIEPLAFGVSGWGTLHSLMAYRVLGPRYDVDVVIYLFTKNDPGDHYAKVQRSPEPTAELSDDRMGFVVRMPHRSESLSARTMRFLGRRLLVAQLIRDRLALMQAQALAKPGAGSAAAAIPDPNDSPTTWPPEMRDEAARLTRRILLQLRNEVVLDGRRFAVMYVPHGNEELDGTLSSNDTWLPWLVQTCAELGIDLWDPREYLRQRRDAAEPVYADHWTPGGHALIASFIAERLAAALAVEGERAGQSGPAR